MVDPEGEKAEKGTAKANEGLYQDVSPKGLRLWEKELGQRGSQPAGPRAQVESQQGWHLGACAGSIVQLGMTEACSQHLPSLHLCMSIR